MIRFDHANLAPGERVEIEQPIDFDRLIVALRQPADDPVRGFLLPESPPADAAWFLENIRLHYTEPRTNMISVAVRNCCDRSVDVHLDALEEHEVERDPETCKIGRALQRDGHWR